MRHGVRNIDGRKYTLLVWVFRVANLRSGRGDTNNMQNIKYNIIIMIRYNVEIILL